MGKIEIISKQGNENIAIAYVGRNRGNNKYLVEFAESRESLLPIEKKFVVIVSSLYGCPVGCLMCDASASYNGKLTKEEILEQIDYIINKRFPNKINCEKLKIQFARVGEPTFNKAVLDVLRELCARYNAPGLMPCISTIAPAGCDHFMDELIKIKNQFYNKGNFQLQFSIHTTDKIKRDRVIPIDKWNFSQIAEYGERFFKKEDRKIVLNFAAIKGNPLDPKVIKQNFNPKKFILKFTPINPTKSVEKHNIKSLINSHAPDVKVLFETLNAYGFETILSIGELEENNIGSNCGQILNSVRQNG